jgi:hypothetical protein
MTPEEQRIAIAEACGWKTGYRDPEAWHPLPDYLNDLNAMHEAEKVLDKRQEDIMNSTLWDIMDGRKYLWHATASQRAESFLRTVGKWKEAKP